MAKLFDPDGFQLSAVEFSALALVEKAAEQLIEKGWVREFTDDNGERTWALTRKFYEECNP